MKKRNLSKKEFEKFKKKKDDYKFSKFKEYVLKSNG